VHINLIADWKSGKPRVMEPDKCEAWGWYDIDHMPEPLFSTTPLVVEALHTKKNYFDA
jgi:hypothetical protein